VFPTTGILDGSLRPASAWFCYSAWSARTTHPLLMQRRLWLATVFVLAIHAHAAATLFELPACDELAVNGVPVALVSALLIVVALALRVFFLGLDHEFAQAAKRKQW